MPIVTFFSFDAGQQNQNGWTAFIIIVALLGALTALSVVFGVKENRARCAPRPRRTVTRLKRSAP